MKIFWPVFFAILAAALVIAVVISVGNSFDELRRTKAETKSSEVEAARLKRETEYLNEEIRRMDPTAPSATP